MRKITNDNFFFDQRTKGVCEPQWLAYHIRNFNYKEFVPF